MLVCKLMHILVFILVYISLHILVCILVDILVFILLCILLFCAVITKLIISSNLRMLSGFLDAWSSCIHMCIYKSGKNSCNKLKSHKFLSNYFIPNSMPLNIVNIKNLNHSYIVSNSRIIIFKLKSQSRIKVFFKYFKLKLQPRNNNMLQINKQYTLPKYTEFFA